MKTLIFQGKRLQEEVYVELFSFERGTFTIDTQREILDASEMLQ